MSNEEIKERVRQIIVDKLGVHEDEVCPAAHLMEDLGADSLDTVELIMEFEKQFDIKISDERSDNIKTVGDINEAIIELTEQQ